MRHHHPSKLCRDAADRNEREDFWRAGRRESVQRLADLQAVAPHHRGERPGVEEAVSAGQSRLPEGGRQRQEGRPVLEGGSAGKLICAQIQTLKFKMNSNQVGSFWLLVPAFTLTLHLK